MTTLPDRVANEICEMVNTARHYGCKIDDVIAELKDCWAESLADEAKEIRGHKP